MSFDSPWSIDPSDWRFFAKTLLHKVVDPSGCWFLSPFVVVFSRIVNQINHLHQSMKRFTIDWPKLFMSVYFSTKTSVTKNSDVLPLQADVSVQNFIFGTEYCRGVLKYPMIFLILHASGERRKFIFQPSGVSGAKCCQLHCVSFSDMIFFPTAHHPSCYYATLNKQPTAANPQLHLRSQPGISRSFGFLRFQPLDEFGLWLSHVRRNGQRHVFRRKMTPPWGMILRFFVVCHDGVWVPIFWMWGILSLGKVDVYT